MTRDIVKTVHRTDPFEDAFRLPSLFDSVFPSILFKETGPNWSAFFTNDTFPYDVKAYKKDGIESKTELVFAVAGIDRDDINVKLDGDYLEINITQKNNTEENVEYIRRGLSHRSMIKKFYLNNVDKANIESKLENGLLTISLPTLKKSGAGKIDIEVK